LRAITARLDIRDEGVRDVFISIFSFFFSLVIVVGFIITERLVVVDDGTIELCRSIQIFVAAIDCSIGAFEVKDTAQSTVNKRRKRLLCQFMLLFFFVTYRPVNCESELIL